MSRLSPRHGPETDGVRRGRGWREPPETVQAEIVQKTDRVCLQYSQNVYTRLRFRLAAVFELPAQMMGAVVERYPGDLYRFQFSDGLWRSSPIFVLPKRALQRRPNDKLLGDNRSRQQIQHR